MVAVRIGGFGGKVFLLGSEEWSGWRCLSGTSQNKSCGVITTTILNIEEGKEEFVIRSRRKNRSGNEGKSQKNKEKERLIFRISISIRAN